MHSVPIAAGGADFSPDWIGLELVLLQLFIILFLVLLNGFFVAAEFALVKARGSQLDALAGRGASAPSWRGT